MKKKLFSIGEVSKARGITKKALLFYEKIGLLKPHYIDPNNKYRYYSMEQFIYMNIIKACRTMNIGPNIIKEILDTKDTNKVLEFISQQKEETLRKISLLKRIVSMMNVFQSTVQSSISSVLEQDIYFKEITERCIITNNIDNHDEDVVLTELSKFCEYMEDNNLINAYEVGFFCTLEGDSQFQPYQLYNSVLVDNYSNTSALSSIPSGQFICICFHNQNVQDKIAKLNSYLNQNNLKPKLILQVSLLDNLFETDIKYIELQALI